jgi:hypothetical protein
MNSKDTLVCSECGETDDSVLGFYSSDIGYCRSCEAHRQFIPESEFGEDADQVNKLIANEREFASEPEFYPSLANFRPSVGEIAAVGLISVVLLGAWIVG